MSFSKLGVVKFIASGVVGVGTGKIVGQIIKNNITPETLIEKVTVTAAAWVIGVMAAEATKSHTDQVIDETVESVAKVINQFKIAAKVSKVNDGKTTFVAEGLNPLDFEKKDGKWVQKPKTVATINGEAGF